MIKMLLMLVGMILAISSCSKQKAPPFLGEQSVLVFDGELEFEKASRSVSSSKATENALATGTNIGIYVRTMVADGIQIPITTIGDTPLKNLDFTSGADNSIESKQHIVLHTGLSRYGVYAYSPRNITEEPLNGHKLPVFHDTDILWARVENFPAEENGTSVSLGFEHRGALIKFKLVDNSETKKLNFDNATLTVSGFANEGTMDVETGVLTLDPERKQSWEHFNIGKTETDETNILVDGNEVTISVTLDGVTDDNLQPVARFMGTDTFSSASGMRYSYEIKVGYLKPIEFVCNVTDWIDTKPTDVPAM